MINFECIFCYWGIFLIDFKIRENSFIFCFFHLKAKNFEKVFNWSELHLSEMTSYKLHTLEARAEILTKISLVFWERNDVFIKSFRFLLTFRR